MYEYDMGDSWVHYIEFMEQYEVKSEEEALTPICMEA